MARTYRFLVGQVEDTARLDRFLVSHLPQTFSRAAIQRAIEQGVVTVDGQPVKSHRRLKPGQAVEARFAELAQPSRGALVRPEPIPLDVVFEDDQLLVINKPPGLVSHPAPGHWTGTLVNAVLWHLSQAASSKPQAAGTEVQLAACSLQPGLPRAGLVHRLDKDTSGLLVVAKTDLALRLLARQLKSRTMSRRYLALVDGHPPFDEGTLDAAIGRHSKDRKLMTVRHLGGRPAVTHYRVLQRLSVKKQTEHLSIKYTVVEVTLETGRTHQIRVHFAHFGYPILGDPVYSRHSAAYWARLGIPRQLLHACAIRFTHPTTHHPVEFQASLPADFAAWIPASLGGRLDNSGALC